MDKKSTKTGKHPGGRPRKYNSPKEMQIAVEAYFKKNRTKATICGLALALGFNSRQSLLNYEGVSPEFLDVIKTAKLKVENQYEMKLFGKCKPTGPIFALKQFGWQDTQKVEHDITESLANFIKSIANG